MLSMASCVLGVPYGCFQWCPMLATLKQVHGGLAHNTSGWSNGVGILYVKAFPSLAVKRCMSLPKSGQVVASLSTERVCQPAFLKALLMLLVPLNRSIIIIVVVSWCCGCRRFGFRRSGLPLRCWPSLLAFVAVGWACGTSQRSE